MESFSSYGHYFRDVSTYQGKFKEVFSFSPHTYPIHLSTYYYNKYRAVSMSVLGVSDLALDNDMFGYSPYFYFHTPSLKTLFPIQFKLIKYSYIKFRFLLPVQFFRGYSEFIHKFTRIRFADAQSRSQYFEIFKFAFPQFTLNRYTVKDSFLYKKRVRRFAGQEVRARIFTRHLRYMRLSCQIKGLKFKSQWYIFRVFSNPTLSLPKKSRFVAPKAGFSFKQFGVVSEILRFSVSNYAFCTSQIFIPFMQRFIKFIFKLERKLVFTEFFKFYTGSYRPVFAKFFYFTKKFLQKFFSKIEEFCSFTVTSVSNPLFSYFVFLSNEVNRLSAFFVSLVCSLLHGPYVVPSVSLSFYRNLSSFFIYNSVLWAKFSFVFNFINFTKLKFMPKPYIHFKIPGNLKSNFFSQFLRFRNISYGLIFFYFSFIGLFKGPLQNFLYGKSFFNSYNFYLEDYFIRSTVFFFPEEFYKTGVNEFFGEIESTEATISRVLRICYFAPSHNKNLKNFENLQFSRYFSLSASVYATRLSKINFSKKPKQRRRRYFFFHLSKLLFGSLFCIYYFAKFLK